MRVINKILLAIDLSKYTEQQLLHASPIIRQLACEVILLHALPPFAQRSSEYLPHEHIETFMEDTITAIKAQLQELHKKYIPNTHVIIETPVGDPITLIPEYATRYACSIIMVGKSYKNSLERFFLGSVASTLVTSSPLPILLLG